MSSIHPRSLRDVSSQGSRLPSFDLYGAAHRGLRRALSQLLLRLGTVSPGDLAQTEAVLAELDSVLHLCSAHLNVETLHYHAALERRRPGSSAELERTHEQHHAAIAELRALAGSAGSDPARWRGLHLAYTSYVAEELCHMADEETVIQPLFEELYSKAELQQLNDELIEEHSPQDQLAFLRHMVPAASREGRLELLQHIQSKVPPGPFQGILAELRPTLSEAEFEALALGLRAASSHSE
jgi:hypothetical protein